MDPIKIVEAVAILTLGAWSGYKEIAERRERKREKAIAAKFGLEENPSRCGEHKFRLDSIDGKIGGLETRVAVLDTKVSGLEKCADEIKRDVSEIRDRLS